MTREEAQQRMQELLAQLHGIVSVMNDVAIEGRIERVEFLGSYIHFGVKKGYSYEDIDMYERPRWDGGPQPRELEYIPGVRGPVISEQCWQYSSFRCWPDGSQRDWMTYPDGKIHPALRSSYDDHDDAESEDG